MMTEILIQSTDDAGNVGWVLLKTLDPMQAEEALAYIQGLPEGHYLAQLTDGTSATILAQI